MDIDAHGDLPSGILHQLFYQAIELPTDQRTEFLGRIKLTYPDLYDEVSQLVRFDELCEQDRYLASEEHLEEDVLSGRTIPSIPGYLFERELARGGMGIVYKAMQTSLNRPVAIKLLLSGQLANSQEVHRFLREAKAAASIEHPNIVPIFDIGQVAGFHYYVMAFIDGQSLAELIARGPLPARRAAEIVLTVAQAVERAHRNGILHRDLKPSNILLDQRDTPYVADFGLAKQVSGGESITQTGDVLGTPEFMSPEQARGDVRQIGVSTDVYSLGAVLYYALAGKPPLRGSSTWDTIHKVIAEEPPSLRVANPKIAADLNKICMFCLAKDLRQRYATLNELVTDLQLYLEGKPPIVARQPTVLEKWFRWCLRKPALASILFVAMLTTVLSIFGAVISISRGAVLRQHEVEAIQKCEELLKASASGLQSLRSKLSNLNTLNDLLDHPADWNLSIENGMSIVSNLESTLPQIALKERQKFANQLEIARTAWLKEKRERDTGIAINKILIDSFAPEDGNVDPGANTLRWQAAFERGGYQVMDSPNDNLIGQITRSSIFHVLIRGLDFWGFWEHQIDVKKHVLNLATAVDPDEWRGQLRRCIVRGHGDRWRELANDPGVRSQPGWVIVELALLADRFKEDGIPILRTVQSSQPRDFFTNFSCAKAFSRKDLVSDAFAFFNRAHTLCPDNAAVLNDLGACYLRMLPKQLDTKAENEREKSGIEQARAMFSKAIETDPSLPYPYFNLANVELSCGQPSVGLSLMRRALDLQTDNVQFRQLLAHVLLECEEYEEAISVCRRLLLEKHENPITHLILGLSLDWTGQNEAARTHLLRAFELNPRNMEIIRHVCQHLRRERCWQQTLDVLVKGLEHNVGADRLTLRIDVSEMLIFESQFAQADEELNELIAEKEKLPQAGKMKLTNLIDRNTRWKRTTARLPSFLSKKTAPTTFQEWCDAADVAFLCQNHPAQAVEFYERAFQTKFGDLEPVLLHRAACAGILAAEPIFAATGSARIDENKLRQIRSANTWMDTAIQIEFERSQLNPPDRQSSIYRMNQWRECHDLESVRTQQSLDRLPEPERGGWKVTWTNLDNVISKLRSQIIDQTEYRIIDMNNFLIAPK